MCDYSKVSRNKQYRKVAFLNEFLNQVENLSRNGYVEARGGFIDQQNFGFMGQRHCNDDSLAHTTTHLVRIAREAQFWIWNADRLQQVNSDIERIFARDITMSTNHVNQLRTYRNQWVKVLARFSGCQRDIATANFLEILFGKTSQVDALEINLPFVDSQRVLNEAKDRADENRLARSRFSNDTNRLARFNCQVYIAQNRGACPFFDGRHGKFSDIE